jgi:transcription elongation factor Elf1
MKTHVDSSQTYTCDVCGKYFDREDARNRHMETHVDSSQSYSCGVCGKEFSRADHRNRHEAAHSYSLTCGVCGQYFNRMDILVRHRAQHQTPEAKQRPPMKRPVAPEPGPIPKQQRTVSPPPRTPMENPVGPDVLPEDPETRALQSIRTEEATGNRIQDRYNFTLHEMTASTFPEMVRFLYRQQTTAFKINLSFGFILRNTETGVLRITIPARTTPDFLMFHTSSEQKKTWRGFWRS